MKIIYAIAILVLILSANFISANKVAGSFTITAESIKELPEENQNESLIQDVEKEVSFFDKIREFFKKIFK